MSLITEHCLLYHGIPEGEPGRKMDYELMANAIKTCGADVVGLNEICNEGPDPECQKQTKILAGLTGLENHFLLRLLFFQVVLVILSIVIAIFMSEYIIIVSFYTKLAFAMLPFRNIVV